MKYTIKFHQINKFINNFFISMPFFVNNKKKKINICRLSFLKKFHFFIYLIFKNFTKLQNQIIFLNNKENPFFHFSDHFSE